MWYFQLQAKTSLAKSENDKISNFRKGGKIHIFDSKCLEIENGNIYITNI